MKCLNCLIQWIKSFVDGKCGHRHYLYGYGRNVHCARYQHNAFSFSHPQVSDSTLFSTRHSQCARPFCPKRIIAQLICVRAVFAPHKGFNSHRNVSTAAALEVFRDDFASACKEAAFHTSERNGQRGTTIRSDAFPDFWTVSSSSSCQVKRGGDRLRVNNTVAASCVLTGSSVYHPFSQWTSTTLHDTQISSKNGTSGIGWATSINGQGSNASAAITLTLGPTHLVLQHDKPQPQRAVEIVRMPHDCGQYFDLVIFRMDVARFNLQVLTLPTATSTSNKPHHPGCVSGIMRQLRVPQAWPTRR